MEARTSENERYVNQSARSELLRSQTLDVVLCFGALARWMGCPIGARPSGVRLVGGYSADQMVASTRKLRASICATLAQLRRGSPVFSEWRRRGKRPIT